MEFPKNSPRRGYDDGVFIRNGPNYCANPEYFQDFHNYLESADQTQHPKNICSQCGQPNLPTAIFCSHCGGRIINPANRLC